MIDSEQECFKDVNDNIICQTIDPLEAEKASLKRPGMQVIMRTVRDQELGELLQKAKEENTHKSLFESFAAEGLSDISNSNVIDKIVQASKLGSTAKNRLSEIAIEFDPTLFPDLLKMTQNQGSTSQEKMIRDLICV